MYPIQLFRVPGPYGIPPKSFAVAGATNEDEALALIDKGWHLTLDEARDAEKPKVKNMEASVAIEKAAHEGTEINDLRAEYRELAGKRGGPSWDEATYREKIAALKEK